MKEEDRNVYIFTPAGWQHLETGEVVQHGGIPLDTADIQALKAQYLEDEDEKGVASLQLPVDSKKDS